MSEKLQKLKTRQADAQTLAAQQTNLQSYDEEMADIQKNVTIATSTDAEGKTTYSAVATADLTAEIEDYYYGKASFANDAINNDALASAGATKVSGQDAVIYLNDAKFESNTNVFQINGLTFTALSETAAGEAVTITTQDDVDGIYDMVKDFLKQYNEVIIEMDKLYNADSAKDYEPLTDEEKEAMSESEIEKYEQKIKDALLRRDSNLSSVSSALKNVMASGVEVNGKTMFLFDFGIEKLSYFEAADNEKYAYYIDGDPDSAYTSGEADKLKSLISTDPDTVVSFFTQLSRNLYSKMSELSSSRDGYRSFGTFYDDKKMKTDYDDYTSKIKDLEEKLADYEDKWYAKFASMETAMAKMQSNMSAVTALLGG